MTRICGILHTGSAHRASMRVTLCIGRRSLHILHIFDRGNISDRPSHAAIQPHACWYVARVHVEDTMQLAMQVVYYTTLKTQTMAVACPWILGSRLSILLSSLGECEFVRMLLVAVGVDPDISHAAVQDCHVQTKSMFDQAGSSSRTRSTFLSLSPATGRHHTPTGKVAPQAKTACHDHSFAHTPHAQTMSSSGSRRLCSDLRTRGTIIS